MIRRAKIMQTQRASAPGCCALALGVAAASSLPASAHHSAAVYDMETILTLRGTVSQLEWKNPHVYVFVDVADESGQTVRWALEGESTALMARGGWSPTALTPGDRVSVRVNRSRKPGRYEARLTALITADGTVLRRRAASIAPAVAADGLAGVWDALRGYEAFEFNRGGVTERGAAALGTFDERSSPVQNCLAFPAPIVTFLPYRNEIELAGDRIYLRSEYFSVERVVYMDGRGHPDNGERTDQGHSIGYWDGDVLVVDTALFSDHALGHFRGLPSGAQKHLIERFELSENRTKITVEFVVEDPEYLLEPWAGQIVWDYAPDGEMLPFVCDPEVARRFAEE